LELVEPWWLVPQYSAEGKAPGWIKPSPCTLMLPGVNGFNFP
jgi:hypothetical protein